MRKTKLLGCSLAACLAVAGVALAAEGGTAKDAFKAAQDRIEAQAKAQRKACSRWQGNAREVCEAQAKGREKVAKAQLQARYRPSPEAEKLAKTARADADYEVAKQRCAALQGEAEDRCRQQAKNAREAAIRLAKVEKVQEINAQKRLEEQRLRGQPQAASVPAPKS